MTISSDAIRPRRSLAGRFLTATTVLALSTIALFVTAAAAIVLLILFQQFTSASGGCGGG